MILYRKHISGCCGRGNRENRKRAFSLAVLVNLSTSKVGRRAAITQAAKAMEALWRQEEIVPDLLYAVASTRAMVYAEQVRARVTHPDAAVAEAALVAFKSLGLDGRQNGAGQPISKLAYAEVLAAATTTRGHAAKGREVFLRAACIACHTVDANEPPKGPALWEITTRYNRAQLIESIMKPGANIAQGFDSQWFKLADGRGISGFVTREGGDSLDVRDITGQSLTVGREDIRERGKHEASMMPPGLVDGFTTEELASLLAYLETLTGS